MRSDIWVATKRMPASPPNESRPRSSGFVPATNMITNMVAPISAVVPRSTSGTIRSKSAATIGERNDETLQDPAASFLITREPPGEKKDHGDLRDFRRLKCDRTESNPTTRTVDAHSDVRHETKGESDEGQAEPDPPRPLPEMVVDQGRHRADNKADAEPDHLSLHEKIDVAVTVARERTGAEKHDDADDQHAENGQEQEISTLAMHLVSRRRRHRRTKVCRSAISARRGERLYIRSIFHQSAFFGFVGLAGMISFCPI